MQAGACNGPWGPGSQGYGYEVSRRLTDTVHAPWDDPFPSLMALPASSLIWAKADRGAHRFSPLPHCEVLTQIHDALTLALPMQTT